MSVVILKFGYFTAVGWSSSRARLQPFQRETDIDVLAVHQPHQPFSTRAFLQRRGRLRIQRLLRPASGLVAIAIVEFGDRLTIGFD